MLYPTLRKGGALWSSQLHSHERQSLDQTSHGLDEVIPGNSSYK